MDIKTIPGVRAVEPAWADKARLLTISFSSVSPAKECTGAPFRG
jgi:hypothetical protein